MNKEQFIKYLENPSLMNEGNADVLTKIIHDYPYFQTAHLLYLKNLHQQKSVTYPSQLKVAAAYANDRQRLYELVMQEELQAKIQDIDQAPVKNKQKQTIDISPLEEQILKEAIDATIQLEVEQSKAEDEISLSKDGDKVESVEPPVKKIDEKGKYTFNAWLKELNASGSISTSSTEAEQESNEKLIAKFIVEQPTIREALKGVELSDTEINEGNKEAFFSPVNTARLSIIDDEEFVTETLAGIYEKQAHYEKAIRAYEALSLKYPEKSSTFAARINSLKGKLDKK